MPHTRTIALPANTLSNRIRHVRRLARLSQAAFARRLGIGPSAVAQWESPAGTSPTVENLLKIAFICDVAFEWLATGRGVLRPDAPALPAQATACADDPLEQRLLLAFRRVALRKREPFVRWIEELF